MSDTGARSVGEPNDPDDPYQLATLAFLLPPGGLDPPQMAWLGAVLRKLAANRAGDNAALRARLEREIEEVLRPYR